MMNENEECLFCDRVKAVLGLLFGGALVYFAVDVLLSGRISRLWAGSRQEVSDDDTGE